MSRFSRIAIAILIAAVSLLGLGYLLDDNRIPEPIARILAVSPANGQPILTGTPTATNQPSAAATTISVTCIPTVTSQDAVATIGASPTPTVTIAAQSTPTATKTTITSTVELVGPNKFRINSAKTISLTLWLTTNKGVVPGVTADIFGLTSTADRTFWPVHLRAQDPVTITAGSVVSSVIMLADSGEMLPPFGTYTGTLRLNVAPPGVSKLQAITLNIVPSNQQAELLVDLADSVPVQGGQPIKLVVGAGYTKTTNVQARITQLLDDASESVPVGFIGVSAPVDIPEGSSDELSLTVDAVGLRRALRSGESYTATLVLTADNAPLITREIRLQVAGPKAWWRLETARVTPQFAGEDTVTFDLWFTPQGAATDTNGLKATLISMLDSDGRSIFPAPAQDGPVPTFITSNDQNGLPSVGSQFTFTFMPEDPLRQGVYTGTVQLATDDTIQPVTFALEVPQRDLALSLPETTDATSLVNLGYTRIIPFLPLFSRTNSDTLYLAPETGLTRLADLAIPPANLGGSSGGLGQIIFATPTPTPSAENQPSVSDGSSDSNALLEKIRSWLHISVVKDQSTDETGFPVVLSLSGIRSTGVYTGVTELRSPDLAGPKAIRVNVTVTDFIFWPFFFIILGVVFSTWVAGRLNPATNPDLQRLRNELIRRDINLLMALFSEDPEDYKDVKSAGTTATRMLDQANEYLDDRLMEDAKEAHEGAKKEFEKLRVFDRIRRLRQRNESESAKPETREEIKGLLNSAWTMASVGDLNAAEGKISEALTKLDGEKAAKAKAEQVFGQAEKTPMDGPGRKLVRQARQLYDSGQFREASYSAMAAMEVPASESGYTVQCTTPENYRVAGESLSFRVVPPSGTELLSQCSYTWSVDNQPLTNCTSHICDHVFPITEHGAHEDRKHTVSVVIKPSAGNEETAKCEVEVTIKKPKFSIVSLESKPVAEQRVPFQLARQSEFGEEPVKDEDLICDWSVTQRGAGTLGNRVTHAPGKKTSWGWTPSMEGKYEVKCIVRVAKTGVHIGEAQKDIKVDRTLLDEARSDYRRNQRWAMFGSAAIASLAGVAYVVFFKPTFGTLQDYVLAFLWGAGVDVAKNGLTVTPIFQRLANWLRGTPPKPEGGPAPTTPTKDE